MPTRHTPVRPVVLIMRSMFAAAAICIGVVLLLACASVAYAPFYEGKEWQQRDEAMRSVGIAAQTLMLAAKDMGYDSCPMIGFDSEQVGNLINLPEDHVVGMIVTIGKATKPAWPKPGYLPDEEVIITDKFAA